ncbi:hypothetical protein TNCT_384741 [Trichonephila clavata]|uniref:Uncharacterized protein n=1 Tax=Trichonephila clavata TaxID=2740835 RepID=A0A8X6GIJ5_TRICU|nr:hypothetical protein TNCT_384741 [Trichonephila clavata]
MKCLKIFAVARNCFESWKNLNEVKCEVHIFSEASPIAYGAVAYFRCINDDGEVRSGFIMPKSRVSLLKKLTLPRLEQQ